jgi:hypothetical protein
MGGTLKMQQRSAEELEAEDFMAPLSYQAAAAISPVTLSLGGAQEALFWQQAAVQQVLLSLDSWLLCVCLASNLVVSVQPSCSSRWHLLLLILAASQLLLLAHQPGAYAKYRHAIAIANRLLMLALSFLAAQPSPSSDWGQHAAGGGARARFHAAVQLILLPVAQPLSYFFYSPLPFAQSLVLGLLKSALDVRLALPALAAAVQRAAGLEGAVRRVCAAVDSGLSGLAQAFAFGGDSRGVCGSSSGVQFSLLLLHLYAGCAVPLLLCWHLERWAKLRHLGLQPARGGPLHHALGICAHLLVLLYLCTSLAASLSGLPAMQHAG